MLFRSPGRSLAPWFIVHLLKTVSPLRLSFPCAFLCACYMLGHVGLFATPCTVAHHFFLFSYQAIWYLKLDFALITFFFIREGPTICRMGKEGRRQGEISFFSS